MHVKLIERQTGYRMYEVVEADKWWTARHNVVTGDWYIVNGKSRELMAWSKLWLKIVGACETFAKETIEA